MTKLKRIVLVTIILLTTISCGLNQNQLKKDSFECNEFWISKNADWEIAYDDVKFNQSELIIKSKDSTWGILFPGSLTLKDDTISVNQEAGFPNTCIKIGKVKIGEIVNIDYPKKDIPFQIINDTIIEFDGRQFKRTGNTVISGCWCEWK